MHTLPQCWVKAWLSNKGTLLGAGGDATSSSSAGASLKSQLEDGPGRYELVAFISHMGSNLGCGHYVCHLKRDGRWVLFNDEKVALSAEPPRGLGYLYLFKRKDSA